MKRTTKAAHRNIHAVFSIPLSVIAVLVHPAASVYDSGPQNSKFASAWTGELQLVEEEPLVEAVQNHGESAEDADSDAALLFFHQQQQQQQQQRRRRQQQQQQETQAKTRLDDKAGAGGGVNAGVGFDVGVGADPEEILEVFDSDNEKKLDQYDTEEDTMGTLRPFSSSLSLAVTLGKLGTGAYGLRRTDGIDRGFDRHDHHGRPAGVAVQSAFPSLLQTSATRTHQKYTQSGTTDPTSPPIGEANNVRINENAGADDANAAADEDSDHTHIHNQRRRRASSYAGCALRTVYEESITGLHGNLTDGPQSYLAQRECSWLIRAANASNNPTITVAFSEYATECSYDYLFVYDGGSPDALLLATLSGSTLPVDLVAYSGEMLLVLYSDTNYVLAGFEATYTIAYASDEEGNGGNGGDGNGDKRDGGASVIKNNVWRTVAAAPSLPQSSSSSSSLPSPPAYVFEPRAKHTAVYETENDAMLVFGGYNFVGLYADLFRFHFANASWSLVHRGPAGATPGASSSNATDGGGDGGDVGAVGEDGGEGEGGGGPPRGPAPRHSHTAVQYSSRSGPGEIIDENGMFVLGGTLLKEAVPGEFWLFDLAANMWGMLVRKVKSK